MRRIEHRNPLLSKEGWTRHQEILPKASSDGADGVVRKFSDQRVRRWPSHRLPFVAEELIPLIYRRAYFMHRATPQ